MTRHIKGRNVISEPGAAITLTELQLTDEAKLALTTGGVRIPTREPDADSAAPVSVRLSAYLKLESAMFELDAAAADLLAAHVRDAMDHLWRALSKAEHAFLDTRKPKDDADGAPYEEIDVEIRRLVRLMNGFPGIRTVASCFGHASEEGTNISFVADSQVSVEGLVRVLPFIGLAGGISANRAESRFILIEILGSTSRGLLYELRLCAFPACLKSRLVGEVEAALSKLRAVEWVKAHS